MREEGNDFSLGWVRSQQGQLRAGSGDDELLFCACELAQHRLDDVGWWLDRQRVEEHVRRGRHVRG